ncbi:MAG: hypothetical protein ACYC27_03150 [Armatimonadota bacterium]
MNFCGLFGISMPDMRVFADWRGIAGKACCRNNNQRKRRKQARRRA